MTAVGDRVRLVRCTDQYTHLSPGVEGVVVLIDSMGTVHVRWDGDGGNLGLIPGEDAWQVVNP